MSQKTVVQLTDDLTGDEIPAGKGETLNFALDGQVYEIDLTSVNARALRKALSSYVDAGRRVKTSRGAKVSRTRVDADAKTI
ncbi:MAG: hypothetical protein QOG10_6889, partial [Kribbellaceae bacterium]|nr:hypothetical protein [Kribbellaceae bacterium]